MKTRKPTSLRKFTRKTPIPRSSYPLLLSQDSFCQLFSITRETAAEWKKTYQIPYISLPNRTFYRAKDVQDFIDEHTVIRSNSE